MIVKFNSATTPEYTFETIEALESFLASSQFSGEAGNAYWEKWEVDWEETLPEEIFDILEAPEAEGMGWTRK